MLYLCHMEQTTYSAYLGLLQLTYARNQLHAVIYSHLIIFYELNGFLLFKGNGCLCVRVSKAKHKSSIMLSSGCLEMRP